jgi:hypothetical protein
VNVVERGTVRRRVAGIPTHEENAMKKLMLDVESLSVETFEVVKPFERPRGTVRGAEAGTMMFSDCLSCAGSGIRNCINTQTCC